MMSALRSLLSLLMVEKRTLFRGLLICILCIFPFSFLPVIIRNGFDVSLLLVRIPKALVYTIGFSLIVVLASLIHNYNSLVERAWLFKHPAFVKLGFQTYFDGVGSVTKEIEAYLLGKVGHYHYRLHIADPEVKKPIIEIIPCIDVSEADRMMPILMKELVVAGGNPGSIQFAVTRSDLENEEFLLDKLKTLSKILEQRNISSSGIHLI